MEISHNAVETWQNACIYLQKYKEKSIRLVPAILLCNYNAKCVWGSVPQERNVDTMKMFTIKLVTLYK